MHLLEKGLPRIRLKFHENFLLRLLADFHGNNIYLKSSDVLKFRKPYVSYSVKLSLTS